MLGSVCWWLVAIVAAIITRRLYRWRHPICNGRLPPGSYGVPLLGETLAFFATYTAPFDMSPFLKSRIKKYGSMFKTSIVGEFVIVSTDSEFNHFIFQQEGRLFECWYPSSFNMIFGSKNMGTLHGFMYKYLKSLVMSLFGVESLKENLLPEIEKLALERLSTWSSLPSVEMKEGIAKMIFDLTANKLISYDPDKRIEDIRINFNAIIDGLISFPLNIPGTTYSKCLEGRKNNLKILKRMLKERRASPNKGQADFFDHIIEELQKEGTPMTEEMALDLMFLLLFASYETTSLALTLTIKLLTEHQDVLDKLTEEHYEIIRNRENKDSGITWKEYKSMTFTSQVVNETGRLASIAAAIFRKAIKDVETKEGYTIPAGWGVVICPSTSHMDPKAYEDPSAFNPWRWEGKEVTGGSKDFVAFGGGMRFCVGADFSKLQMSIFLHHLVTKYRWVVTKGGDIVRTPGLKFPNGLHIKLTDVREQLRKI